MLGVGCGEAAPPPLQSGKAASGDNKRITDTPHSTPTP